MSSNRKKLSDLERFFASLEQKDIRPLVGLALKNAFVPAAKRVAKRDIPKAYLKKLKRAI